MSTNVLTNQKIASFSSLPSFSLFGVFVLCFGALWLGQVPTCLWLWEQTYSLLQSSSSLGPSLDEFRNRWIHDPNRHIALIVVGTRPELVKLDPLVHAMRHDGLHIVVCSTGQHRDLLKHLMEKYESQQSYFDVDLALMRPNQSPLSFSARAMVALAHLMDIVQPNLVIVQGDTSSALSAAQTAFYYKIPVAHVEAGLRTYQRYTPFPEEMNRRIISAIATFHFAATSGAVLNLKREGITTNVFETGNTIIDAIRMASSQRPTSFLQRLLYEYKTHKIVVVTVHRRENQGEALERICRAIIEIVELHANVIVMLPLHPNPHVRQVVEEALSHHRRIVLLAPLRYVDMAYLLQQSYAVLTDSGGLQEESSAFAKPVLILRDQTERTELLDSGLGILVGSNVEKIVSEANRILDTSSSAKTIAELPTPYGNGTASKQISQILLKFHREGLW